MNTDYYIYILFDAFGVPRYVGKGRGDRWLMHERRTDPHNWMKNEFIEQAWLILEEVPKIKVLENLTERTARRSERALIEAIGRHPLGPLVNISPGGDGPPDAKRRIPTEAQRAKMSAAQKLRWARASEEQRTAWALGLNLTGRPHRPESIEKIRAWHTGRPMPKTAAMAAVALSRRGVPLSAETRRKMSLVRQGKGPRSPETIAKIIATKATRNYKKTHCVRGHELADPNLYYFTTKAGDNVRACKACMAQRQRERKLSMKNPTIAMGYIESEQATKNPAIRKIGL